MYLDYSSDRVWPKAGLERWGKELAMQGENMGLSFKGKWETFVRFLAGS